MKLKEFTITLGEKVNLGNYNNAEYRVSGTIVVDDELLSDELDEQLDKFRDFVVQQAIAAKQKITRN